MGYSIGDIFSSSKSELLWNLVKKVFGIHHSKKLGVCHADDILYLFRSNLPFVLLSDESDHMMIDFMVDLWTKFAQHHNPNPKDQKWLPCKQNQPNCYVILKDSKIVIENDLVRQKR